MTEFILYFMLFSTLIPIAFVIINGISHCVDEKLMEYYDKHGYVITPTTLLPLTNPMNHMHNTFFNYGLK